MALLHRHKVLLMCALLYLGFALFFTFPQVLHLQDSVLGPPEDNLQSVWNFWWVKKAVVDLKQNYYWSDYLYYPRGTFLRFHTFSPAHTLLSLPLQAVFSPVTLYNLVMIAIFVLRGMSMFLLANHILGNGKAAFLAGFIFAFCPFAFHKSLHHLNISAFYCFPLVVLALLRLYEKPNFRRGLVVGMALALVCLCSWVYMVFLVPIMLFFGVHWLWKDWKRIFSREFLGPFALAGMVPILIVGPFVLPLLLEVLQGESYMVAPEQSAGYLDLAAIFIPSDLHPLGLLLKDIFLRFYNSLPGCNWELNYFMGYTGILLVGMAWACKATRPRLVWVTWTVVFTLLSLGPTLQAGGIDTHVPMPFALMSKIPLVRLARIPGRFFALSLIGISLLAGFGVRNVCAWVRDRFSFSAGATEKLVVGVCLVVLTMEYLPFPVERTLVEAPATSERIRRDQKSRAVLDIPLWGYYSHHKDGKHLEYGKRRYRQTHYILLPYLHMFRQVLHGKRIFSGKTTREPPENLDYYRSSPFRALAEVNLDTLHTPEYGQWFLEEIRERKVGCVMVHGELMQRLHPGNADMKLDHLHGFLDGLFPNVEEAENGIRAYFTNVVLRPRDDYASRSPFESLRVSGIAPRGDHEKVKESCGTGTREKEGR